MGSDRQSCYETHIYWDFEVSKCRKETTHVWQFLPCQKLLIIVRFMMLVGDAMAGHGT
jgi:hypothetical protein